MRASTQYMGETRPKLNIFQNGDDFFNLNWKEGMGIY